MTESTYDMLVQQVEAKLGDITEFARQIESGEYGNAWIATCCETGEETTVIASSEDEAIELHQADNAPGFEFNIEQAVYDDPTIVDVDGNETSIYDYALSVEVKIGKPLQVWLTFGGPNILIESTGYQNTRLEGHWGSESVYRSGRAVETVFDYFVSDLYDCAPDEYK